jgi:tRNA dimethylallyltransferase
VKNAFFIVGPTATGKSELAAEVALNLGAEIVSADAFQVYRGLDLLTAKPDSATLRRIRHHLIGILPLEEEMNAVKFRAEALRVIEKIESKGKLALVVGGSGLYLKALTDGLSAVPGPNPQLRTELNALTLDQLCSRLLALDPGIAGAIDLKNRRRLVRALEICLVSGKPASTQRLRGQPAAAWSSDGEQPTTMRTRAPTSGGHNLPGVFVLRERDDLYDRINRRVEAMFENGVVEEVRAAPGAGPTASQMIGLLAIRELVAGHMSAAQCVAEIQQATRRYAKRQLTWFRRQTSFEPLNLSLLTHSAAVEWMTQRAARSLAHRDD